jgi:hypothetical protein
MRKVKAVTDDNENWYVIPNELEEEFYDDLENEDMVESGKFDKKWEQYTTGGDLNSIQLWAEKKVLNYCFTEYGQIFWDENNNIIDGLHQNDGKFREEFMSQLFEHFGVEVVFHKKIPTFVKEWEFYENYGEI